jgi:sugar lactone lactonase YvrE
MNVSDTVLRRLSVVALASVVAGCAGNIPPAGTSSQATGPAMQAGGEEQSGWLAPEALAKNAKLIYAAGYNTSTGAVFVYEGKKPYKQVGELPSGSGFVSTCYVDGKGNVYVVNRAGGASGNGFVREFKKGKTKPAFEYTNSLSSPSAIAVGNDGTLYVANDGNSGGVVEFPQKSNKPALIIPSSLFAPEIPNAIAIDSANNLYVGTSTFGNSPQYNVWEFPPSSANGTALNLTGLDDPSSIIIDKNNNLVVGNGDGGLVNVYPAGQVNPSKQFSVAFGTTQIVFDKAENIFYWVGSAFGVHAYSYKTGNEVQEFDGPCPSGGSFCFGVAVSPPAQL